MREGALVQALHHNSLLVDPHNVTGNRGILERPTEWNGRHHPPPDETLDCPCRHASALDGIAGPLCPPPTAALLPGMICYGGRLRPPFLPDLYLPPPPVSTTGYRTRERVSMSIPIVLPITDFTKGGIEVSGKRAVALTTKDGQVLAILRDPEIYQNRKEEIVAR
jgi:hypothetical protein